MARYWIFLNDKVDGPYPLDHLIRVRGFSRQTMVCIDDGSGQPKNWISPADIPELSHIFKAVDEHLHAPVLPPSRKVPPKPAPHRPIRAYTPAVVLKEPDHSVALFWSVVAVIAMLGGGGYYVWMQRSQSAELINEQAAAQRLVSKARLPASNPFGTVEQYLDAKGIKPTWSFERIQEGLMHVSLSAYNPSLTVYAFEANVPAQSVRGLNTAATKLLNDSPVTPTSDKPKAAAAPKKSSADLFTEASEARRDALESGDFNAVWDSFSRRQKADMSKGGMSKEGFIRLQTLTRKVDSPIHQTIAKSKQESEHEMLLLIKQTQANRPDIFVKQLWVMEEGAWKMDDEQKRAAPAADEKTPAPAAGGAPVIPAALPGMSH